MQTFLFIAGTSAPEHRRSSTFMFSTSQVTYNVLRENQCFGSIRSGQWIRIWIRNPDPDPIDPQKQKKVKKFHVFKF
jgi:hypothetical protein